MSSEDSDRPDDIPDSSDLDVRMCVHSMRQFSEITPGERVWKKAEQLRGELDHDTLDELTLAYEGRLSDLKGVAV
jgi:hypothetical protein